MDILDDLVDLVFGEDLVPPERRHERLQLISVASQIWTRNLALSGKRAIIPTSGGPTLPGSVAPAMT